METYFVKISVGTPGPGYPLLLSLGKSLVVIVNYALTTEQPDPVVRSPTLPANGPGPAPRLGEGPVTPRAPGEVALSRDSWGPRIPCGAPDLPRSAGPPPSHGHPYTI